MWQSISLHHQIYLLLVGSKLEARTKRGVLLRSRLEARTERHTLDERCTVDRHSCRRRTDFERISRVTASSF